MEHIEFIDKEHFENEYRRQWAKGQLSSYIDFCWETNFDLLLEKHPEGFADVLFPNIGYTYLINLATPVVMNIGGNKIEVKGDGFLPRHKFISCQHSIGNKLFGIKFKICPIIFEKDVDFSEYKEYIYPLAYLIDRSVVIKVREAASFAERVELIFDHYNGLISKYASTLKYVDIVASILKESADSNDFNLSIKELAEGNEISKRTLQHYFEATTSFSSKQAFKTLRMRKAITDLTTDPNNFSYTSYGYYDYSHFCKHLKDFTGKYFLQFQQFYNERKKPAIG